MKELKIIWSPLAEETYLHILSYILDQWSLKEAEAFESKVESLIEKLKSHKHLCPPSKKKIALRRCVIVRQSSMIYQVKGSIIEIVLFIDNRSKHPY